MTNTLNLDETEQHMFEHTLSGYGVVVCGGDPDSRERSLLQQMDDPLIVTDCREINSMDEFYRAVIEETDVLNQEELERLNIGTIEMRRALNEANANILIKEFDELPTEVQTSVAQCFKGIAEHRDFEGQIGYTCKEGDCVVSAEWDLSARVKSWSIDDN